MTDNAKIIIDTASTDSEALDRIFKNRRSVRAYLRNKPDRKEILEILDAARYAPNSCNLQHYGFIYIDDDAVLKSLEPVATRKVSWAPSLIVIIDDSRFSVSRSAGLQSIAAATENIILSAAAKGLGTCWMAGFKGDKGIRKILNIPSYFEITGLLAIGYPDPDNPAIAAKRLELTDYIHFNKYESKPVEFIEDINVDHWPMNKLISYRDRIGSVYAPRKGVQLYHKDMVEECVRRYTDLQNQHQGRSREDAVTSVDIASYDGCFIRQLCKSQDSLTRKTQLFAADYSPYFLNLIKSQCPDVKTVVMDLSHKIEGPDFEPCDFLSLVFKIDFLPETEEMLRSLKNCVKKDGRLFLASVPNTSPRAMLYKLDSLFNRPNMYEKNKLYRFGPYRHLATGTIEKKINSAGWIIESKGNGGHWPQTDFKWWWLAPAPQN